MAGGIAKLKFYRLSTHEVNERGEGRRFVSRIPTNDVRKDTGLLNRTEGVCHRAFP
jgi:hypothetical protein